MSPVVLSQVVVPVQLNQPLQHGHITPELFAAFGVGHAAGGGPLANDGDARDDVHAVADSCVDRFEVVVLGEEGAVGFEDERETVIAVGFGEGPVDGDRLAAAFDRGFPGLDADRDVTVDDQPALGIDAEFGQDLFAEPRLVDEGEVRVLGLVMRGLVGDEVPLQCRDAVLAEER